MKYFLAVLLVLISTNSAFGFARQCRNGEVEPISVQSPACGATTCTVARGSSLIAVADIRATAAHATLRSTFDAFFLGIWSDISGQQDTTRVCFEIGDNVGQNSCPLTAGQVFRWNINVGVPTNIPAFTQGVPVRIQVLEGTSLIACTEVTAIIN